MNPTENPSPANSDCQGSTESEIRRYDGGLGPREADQVVVEEPLEIRVNSEPFATLLRTPGQDANLALGFLYAEGVIDCRKDIGALSLCGEDALAGPGGEFLAPFWELVDYRGRRVRGMRSGCSPWLGDSAGAEICGL